MSLWERSDRRRAWVEAAVWEEAEQGGGHDEKKEEKRRKKKKKQQQSTQPVSPQLFDTPLQCQVLSVRSFFVLRHDRIDFVKTVFAHPTDAVPYISTKLVVFQWKMDFWSIDRSR